MQSFLVGVLRTVVENFKVDAPADTSEEKLRQMVADGEGTWTSTSDLGTVPQVEWSVSPFADDDDDLEGIIVPAGFEWNTD